MIEQNKHKIGVSSDHGLPERRRHFRYPFTATVELVEPNSQTRIQGRTSDLSRGGCYVDSTCRFSAGSIVKIRLTKEMCSFEARADVVYSLDGMGMGVKFTGADSEQLSTLEKWMAELSGEQQPRPELPQPSDQSCAQQRLGNEEYFVLSELVLELMRQGVLSNSKCEALLRKLNRGTRKI
jgi:hypothetical protein